MMNRRQGELFGLLIGTGLALLASAIEPTDWLTWWMEVLPVLIGGIRGVEQNESHVRIVEEQGMNKPIVWLPCKVP